MVQLVALLYKEQHVTTLTKLLNVWLEASQSDSSEDNESNTSPPDRGQPPPPSAALVRKHAVADIAYVNYTAKAWGTAPLSYGVLPHLRKRNFRQLKYLSRQVDLFLSASSRFIHIIYNAESTITYSVFVSQATPIWPTLSQHFLLFFMNPM